MSAFVPLGPDLCLHALYEGAWGEPAGGIIYQAPMPQPD
jgi:hypothetical protein